MNKPTKRETIYTCFATEDYRELMLAMTDSLKAVGIPSERIHAYNAKLKGDWYSRVKSKVSFMRQMCEDFPDNNVCWIDADAVAVKPLKFFEEFDGDWGMAHEPRPGRNGDFFLSNAYIVYPSSKSMSMLLHWEYLVATIKSRTPDQTAFNHAWILHQPEIKLDFREVPLGYCWYQPHAKREPYRSTEPIIIHDIVSRKIIPTHHKKKKDKMRVKTSG